MKLEKEMGTYRSFKVNNRVFGYAYIMFEKYFPYYRHICGKDKLNFPQELFKVESSLFKVIKVFSFTFFLK